MTSRQFDSWKQVLTVTNEEVHGSEPKVTRFAKINKVKNFDLVDFCLRLSKDRC